VQHWCARSGIAYLGRADIGHDADNKVVPFG
jgi:muramoyltetrapeptide carboxypeptidase